MAAFGVAYAAKRSTWLSRTAHPTDTASVGASDSAAAGAGAGAGVSDATAAYLMPLLAILAAGMLARAMSGGFDFLYPLRFLCAIIALWSYRRSYGNVDWRFSWRGVATGVAIFALWAAFARLITTPAAIPDALARLSDPARGAWILCRVAAAVGTVPIAEELAYRGFLMRRLEGSAFESVALRSVRWPAILISAVAFGIVHGSFWIPGIAAGLAYGAVAVRTGKIGESVAAHATTNALIAIQVLFFDQWQLW